MQSSHNPLPVQSIIRNSGIVAMNTPSIDHPIPVALFYRNNPDGSVLWLWPKGNTQADFSKFYHNGSLKAKWISRFYKIFFAVGLGTFIAHGRLVLYTDLPTATYIQNQWRRD